jgi:RNA polymerase sigma-70 factor (ECF subfamily)
VDDSSLIERARAGDAEAAGLLWERHRRWVAAVALAHKRAGADLEDVLQDVALTMVSKLGQLGDAGLFRGWLRSVAVNAARAEGRKHGRRRGLLRLVPGREADEAPAEQASAAAGGIDSLLERLPAAYRECVLLRCVRGMSYAQISAITGLPETTLETRIARGRRLLRELARSERMQEVADG